MRRAPDDQAARRSANDEPARRGVQLEVEVIAVRLVVARRECRVEEARAVVVEPPPNLGLSPQTVGHAGKIRVQLQGATSLISAADAIAALDSYPVSVTSITYTGLNQGPSVSIEATYQVPGQ